MIWSVRTRLACLHDQDVAKKNIHGDSEARGGVRFSQALPAVLVKFKRLGWQTARFLTLALGSSHWLMDYRSEPGRLTVILARSVKGALIYNEEKESSGLWRTRTFLANEKSMKLCTGTSLLYVQVNSMNV